MNQSFGGAWDCGLSANRDPDTAVSDAGGKMDKAKGTARNVAGDVKDAARDAMDND